MDTDNAPEPDAEPAIPELVTPAQAGAVLGVNPKTVSRWAAAGRLPSIKTLGGHRRYRREDVLALLKPEHE